MKIGDVITQINGRPVENTGQLRNLVASTDPGAKTELTIIREGKERVLAVIVGVLPEASPRTAAARSNAEPSGRFGLTAAPLTDQAAHELGVEPGLGVLIESVETDSPADAAGIHPGDLIVEVNREHVTTVDELTAALEKTGSKVLLLLKVKDGSRFVVLAAK